MPCLNPSDPRCIRCPVATTCNSGPALLGSHFMGAATPGQSRAEGGREVISSGSSLQTMTLRSYCNKDPLLPHSWGGIILKYVFCIFSQFPVALSSSLQGSSLHTLLAALLSFITYFSTVFPTLLK